ncbi:MAG: hypothetical protein FD157_3835 [Rhodocyclaceae bacterium]|nr:MAG: hypothetical protein FD157_3835 [Rhodocyclaceae bacterium]TND05437.1 MAG: hypothetical protein FD118_515 [Rhodocyclaceae bacterium]
MINAPQLLADLTRRLTLLEADLRERIDTVPDLKTSLQAEWQAARDAERTAETFESWADQVITQAGVHWLLSCVFLRFIEDNELVDRPWIGGTPDSGRLNLARDRHEAYFRAHPLETDREYLLACFREAGSLPGLHTFFDEAHNPVFRLGISGDAAMALRSFWQQQDPNTGALLHDFTDPAWNTRFLGDLYQDLSEATRKRYALLQTPEFVEEFILDRTLTPAIREFGYREVRMIDPTCGSGHFLLGGFQRMADEWSRAEPARNRRDVAQKALDAVAGVDLNPFAVAISRFRLLVAALQASDVHRLSEAPNFKFNLAAGDSLLHGPELGRQQDRSLFDSAETHRGTALEHAYASEDLAEVNRILGQTYHAVVGNPPYITVKDAALNAAYRNRYKTCHMKYSLGVPFTERFFELARRPASADFSQDAGYVGLITANSFMKREFGKKLIEEFFPRVDFTHVIDTSGAYIPGHGTPTVILFGRDRAPVVSTVRTVMGIKGEPSTPDDPAQGLVWRSIVDQIDVAGSESAFVSVADTPRTTFARHPWSIGGGGAADLKEAIEAAGSARLESAIHEMGFGCVISEEEAFWDCNFIHLANASEMVRPIVAGDEVRDWQVVPVGKVLFPYDAKIGLLSESRVSKALWWARTLLGARRDFGNRSYREVGRPWWEYHQIPTARNRTPLTITFAEVATHNHFVLDRGGKVFNRTAPVIKLPAGASEDEHLGLLGLLNSSVACFWLKQVCHNKGSTVDQHGARQRTSPFEDFYAFNSTKVAEFPLIDNRPLDIATRLDTQARQLAESLPVALLADAGTRPLPTRASLDAARDHAAQLRRMMIASQDELDWRCYRPYDLLPSGIDASDLECDSPPEVALGERAFEIALARRVAAGTEQTTWFERHGSTPITEIPSHWPEDYRRIVQRRIDLIASDRNIGLIERPEYKRRWNSPSWESLEQVALKDWLLNRLEAAPKVGAGDTASLTSTNKLVDQMRADADFMEVAALYAGHADFDPAQLVAERVVGEAVPFLPVLRYTETGLRKRAQWEATWASQRREDAGESVGKIPVPPKYQSKDFLKSDVWRLRGGLDVPKERWISYPGCERGADGSLVIAWAGWNHLQQATAIAAYYLDMKDNEGWPPERLQPLLAGIQELVPWLQQWHNDLDPTYGERMGDYYKGFAAEEARTLGFTLDDLRAWRPAATVAKRGRKKAA